MHGHRGVVSTVGRCPANSTYRRCLPPPRGVHLPNSVVSVMVWREHFRRFVGHYKEESQFFFSSVFLL